MKNRTITGKLFDIKGFSVHDGPGIRLTLFLKGCRMRCPWCHSPESQAFYTELNWNEGKCVGIDKCGRCLDSCPRDAISPGKIRNRDHGENSLDAGIQLVAIDRAKCDICGACAENCAAGALFMCGTDYSADEIMERIRRETPFFSRSGGGVTISGGECLCQPEFTLEILKRCKKESIHTAVDTSGFVEWEVIEPILPYTDIFLYDIKGIDATLHEQATGVPNRQILENARKIAAANGNLHIRIPIIPGYSDSSEVVEGIGKFIIELGAAVKAVSLLPYHKLGVAKLERLQLRKPEFKAEPPSNELLGTLKKHLEEMGLNVVDS
ncbi:MAG: glycyl-radical enzyme activating protein [Oscillospiraceae bacterium]|nr:glycyl-radical enzyme activating protein [Oscillospiraceae bacterium]